MKSTSATPLTRLPSAGLVWLEGRPATTVVLWPAASMREMRPVKPALQGPTGQTYIAMELVEGQALSERLAGVIGRCLAKDPGQRYQRGDEVRAALDAVASGQAAAAAPARQAVPASRRGLIVAAAGVAALLALAAGFYAFGIGGMRSRITGGAAAAPARAIRLAVLPFENLSGDAEQEYLSDGITTEMIAQLGRLRPATLSVIARTSVMRYKTTDKTIDQIGRELGVDARRYDEAIAQARAALRMQPDAGVATTALILSLHETKRCNEVIATIAGVYAAPLFGYPEVADALTKGYAELGYTGAWRRATGVETAKHGTEPGVAFAAATNYVMAGDNARALDWLEKAYEQRDPNLPYLSCMPVWDPLGDVERFEGPALCAPAVRQP